MSDLQNPLFDEEKEFLERKKLEYERALRGDVDHIKDQSVKVGKIAAVGAGLVGGIWLITKAFSGKKKKKHNRYRQNGDEGNFGQDFGFGFDQEAFDRAGARNDDETGAEYYTAGNGKRYKSKVYRKSAADSAQAFAEHDRRDDYDEHGREADDLGFGAAPRSHSAAPISDNFEDESPFDMEDFEDDPFQDLPYDDSRRLPASRAFDGQDVAPAPSRFINGSRLVGEVLQSFLKTDTGKVLVGQVAAVVLALVTKKVSEFFPAAQKSELNSDLAVSDGRAPAETGFAPVVSPVATSVSLDSPDASTHSQSL